MPETGDHPAAQTMYNALLADGFICNFATGNGRREITYRFERGKERRYLIAQRDGRHHIETSWAAYSQWLRRMR